MSTLCYFSSLVADFYSTVVRQQLAKEYAKTQCQRDPLCLEDTHFPLMKNIRQGLIDPDTPESAKSVKALEGKTWKLVVRWLSLCFNLAYYMLMGDSRCSSQTSLRLKVELFIPMMILTCKPSISGIREPKMTK